MAPSFVLYSVEGLFRLGRGSELLCEWFVLKSDGGLDSGWSCPSKSATSEAARLASRSERLSVGGIP
jgi:hypothetical protein